MDIKKITIAVDLLKTIYSAEINKKRESLKIILTRELYENELKTFKFLEDGLNGLCDKFLKIANGESISLSIKEEHVFKKAYPYCEYYLNTLVRTIIDDKGNEKKEAKLFNRQLKNNQENLKLIMEMFKSQKIKC